MRPRDGRAFPTRAGVRAERPRDEEDEMTVDRHPGAGPLATIAVDVASSDRQLEQIVELQRRNLRDRVAADEQATHGFVFAEHTVPLLRTMAAALPQVIATSGGVVVGYNLAMSVALRDTMPQLVPMFDEFDRTVYRGRPLSTYEFVVGGQVCVDRAFRGRGLLGRLYRETVDRAPRGVELCVTEIAARNAVSLKAHRRAGFEVISSYHDGAELWCIAVWDRRSPPPGG